MGCVGAHTVACLTCAPYAQRGGGGCGGAATRSPSVQERKYGAQARTTSPRGPQHCGTQREEKEKVNERVAPGGREDGLRRSATVRSGGRKEKKKKDGSEAGDNDNNNRINH